MNDAENGSSVPSLEGDQILKEYRCPHCGKFLLRGNV